MSYIKSYGTAFPHFRIEDNVLNPKGKKGVMKAVCFPDEDIITLAYRSASAFQTEQVDGILFATSTPVFKNRYHASYLADLLHLPSGILALDFVNTPRSGSDALKMAHELISGGNYNNILVVAANVCFPDLGAELNTPFGHAACSILVSGDVSGTEIVSARSFSAAYAEEFSYKNAVVRYDPRFSRDAGFKKNITAVLSESKINPKEVDSIILNSVYAKMTGSIFTKAGFEETQFSRDTLTSKIGNTDAPHALLLLVNDLMLGKKNILLADYTNGTNLFEIRNSVAGTGTGLKEDIGKSEQVLSYQDYLLLSKAGDFEALSYHPKEMFTSEIMTEREKDTLLYLEGHKCDHCGTVYLLKSARCKKCRSTDFTKTKLSRTGTVFAVTQEHYFPASFPPVSMLVIDLDGGGRVTVQQTDTMYPDKNVISIGSSVLLVLRKMMENDIKPDYFWKATPL